MQNSSFVTERSDNRRKNCWRSSILNPFVVGALIALDHRRRVVKCPRNGILHPTLSITELSRVLELEYVAKSSCLTTISDLSN
ncbi:unnamed protein product [Meloidogyne enterolobii]|uniref:Uncharacterized protein n=1 Tax=Meloidogyne enterolobii TaxID=390850 RepID=A0ACB0XLR7_MELEN